MTSAAQTNARHALTSWAASQPSNYYTADGLLPRLILGCSNSEFLRLHEGTLRRFGALCATDLADFVASFSLPENAPRMRRFDSFGRPIEDVVFHPHYHDAGRLIRASGILECYSRPANNLLASALMYLCAHLGECGHVCPIACTIGVIQSLSELAEPSLKNRYLPALLDPGYDRGFHGAQYLTEIQGGSDVGANDCTAVAGRARDAWSISGTKWFCSNVTAHLALVTARPTGSPDGTKGLGLFLVPRLLDDGSINSFSIHRLKEKIGTRSLATGEITFKEAIAYQLGPLDRGFANMMKYAITTSRLFNCVLACGAARMAFIQAASYSRHRFAFGKPLVEYPLVQQTLTRVRLESSAMLAGTMHLATIKDRIDAGDSHREEEAFFRIMLSLVKSASSIMAADAVRAAIECFGGNGVIESFSVLPRLLGDCAVYENWEGTHNVLLKQAVRDLGQPNVLDDCFEYLENLYRASWEGQATRAPNANLARLRTILQQRLMSGDELFIRPFGAALAREYFGLTLSMLLDRYRSADGSEADVSTAIISNYRRSVPEFSVPQIDVKDLALLSTDGSQASGN
jgi:acyl-CoA dehydrogenase